MELELAPELVQEDSNGKYYFVMKTDIFCDEVGHQVINMFLDKKEAYEYAEEMINKLVSDNYHRVDNGFYGDKDGIVYVLLICEKSSSSKNIKELN